MNGHGLLRILQNNIERNPALEETRDMADIPNRLPGNKQGAMSRAKQNHHREPNALTGNRRVQDTTVARQRVGVAAQTRQTHAPAWIVLRGSKATRQFHPTANGSDQTTNRRPEADKKQRDYQKQNQGFHRTHPTLAIASYQCGQTDSGVLKSRNSTCKPSVSNEKGRGSSRHHAQKKSILIGQAKAPS